MIIPTERNVLLNLDEYSLYCHYLGYDPIPKRGKYSSPLRKGDTDPSFGIFVCTKRGNVEYMWKDQGLGISGDIFDLVRFLISLDRDNGKEVSRGEAAIHIAKEFGLLGGTVKRLPIKEAPLVEPATIRVVPQPLGEKELAYAWSMGIKPETLERFNFRGIKYYWIDNTRAGRVPSTKSPAFLYTFLQYYKLYFPLLEKENKFRTDYPEWVVEGYLQLQFNVPNLIVTKSYKEVAYLSQLAKDYQLPFECVSPKSENTPIDRDFWDKLNQKYPNILLWFDNDGKHRADFYPDKKLITIPTSYKEKDPTDFRSVHGEEATVALTRSLLDPYLLLSY